MRRFYFFGILLQVCYRLNVVVVFVVVVIICIFVQEVVAHFSPLNTCWKTGLQPLVITVCIQLTKVWSAKMRFWTVSLDGLTKIRIKHIIWSFFYSHILWSQNSHILWSQKKRLSFYVQTASKRFATDVNTKFRLKNWNAFYIICCMQRIRMFWFTVNVEFWKQNTAINSHLTVFFFVSISLEYRTEFKGNGNGKKGIRENRNIFFLSLWHSLFSESDSSQNSIRTT